MYNNYNNNNNSITFGTFDFRRSANQRQPRNGSGQIWMCGRKPRGHATRSGHHAMGQRWVYTLLLIFIFYFFLFIFFIITIIFTFVSFFFFVRPTLCKYTPPKRAIVRENKDRKPHANRNNNNTEIALFPIHLSPPFLFILFYLSRSFSPGRGSVQYIIIIIFFLNFLYYINVIYDSDLRARRYTTGKRARTKRIYDVPGRYTLREVTVN